MMIDAKNIVPITPFDADDRKIASRLGIILPDIWMSERYEARLDDKGVVMQIDPDEAIKALDRLDVGNGSEQPFGVLIDSLSYDEGPETVRKYNSTNDYRYRARANNDNDKNLPFFTLLADPTPTFNEKSASLTDRGFLIGSKVMAEMLDDTKQESIEKQRQHRMNKLTIDGTVVQVGSAVGNAIAYFSGWYGAVPILHKNTTFPVVVGGLVYRAKKFKEWREIKNAEVCDFVDYMVEGSVEKVADQVHIFSFVPAVGSSEESRQILKSIREGLDKL